MLIGKCLLFANKFSLLPVKENRWEGWYGFLALMQYTRNSLMGCHHSSVDISVPTILLPWV